MADTLDETAHSPCRLGTGAKPPQPTGQRPLGTGESAEQHGVMAATTFGFGRLDLTLPPGRCMFSS